MTIGGRLSVNSALVASAFAIDGFGIAACPRFVVEEDIRAGRLVSLLDDYAATGSPLNLLYLGGRTMPRKLRAFIDFAVADIGRGKVL